MLQTDRKTEQTRQPNREREDAQRRQQHETQAKAALALEAILAGGSWDQLPAEGVLHLSHTLGNAALTELWGLRQTGPEQIERTLPRGGLATPPMELGGLGPPQMISPPDFGAMPPVSGASPMAPMEI